MMPDLRGANPYTGQHVATFDTKEGQLMAIWNPYVEQREPGVYAR